MAKKSWARILKLAAGATLLVALPALPEGCVLEDLPGQLQGLFSGGPIDIF